MKIDPEFESYLPTISESEYLLLRQSIMENGLINPIIVWRETQLIIDGHSRYRIYKELETDLIVAGKSFLPVKTISFPDRDSVKRWMLEQQLGRRNLPDERRKYFLGQLYLARKHQGIRTASGMEYQKSTAEELAKEAGVSEKTIRNAAAFVRAVEKITSSPGLGHFKDLILNGTLKISEKELIRLSDDRWKLRWHSILQILSTNPGLAINTYLGDFQSKTLNMKAEKYFTKLRNILSHIKVGIEIDNFLDGLKTLTISAENKKQKISQ